MFGVGLSGMPSYGVGGEGNRPLPLSQIIDMQQKGLTNNQIIQALQRDGYSITEIFDALNQAGLQAVPPGEVPGGAPALAAPSQPGMPAPPPAPPQSQPGGVSTEELVEAIIDEKWGEVVQDIKKVIDWKESMTARIEKLEQRFDDLQSSFDKLQDALLGKIGEYDKNLSEVGAELKAMEKVFSKVLPAFTQNVAELSRISERLSKKG